MIQYDENTGDAAGLEKRLLVSEGFSPGVKVEIIEGHANEGSIFVIKSIEEDGLVKPHNDKDTNKIIKSAFKKSGQSTNLHRRPARQQSWITLISTSSIPCRPSNFLRSKLRRLWPCASFTKPRQNLKSKSNRNLTRASLLWRSMPSPSWLFQCLENN